MAQMGRPRNPMARFNAEGERWCGHCCLFMPLEQFYPSKQGDGYDNWCRECRKAYVRERYHAHPEQDLARARAWAARYPARRRAHRRIANRIYKARLRFERQWQREQAR